ncbi:hypothetical protein BG011_003858 [Mortierella polycephala]|uniref:DNA polymerase delta subunit 4 n=1 Tax=Mortierella polycephala TaxID=41804 RepID=A0A9P6Q357_9FUNG|nr:hypothetical protein BG011_003858 [Mortierella polycephala]
MTPPKKSAPTVDSAANFFQRGKKPTTTQRVVTAKKATTSTTNALKPVAKQQQRDVEMEDGIDDIEDSDEDQSLHHHSGQDKDNTAEKQQVNERDEAEDDNTLLGDEIQSDDSDSGVAADLQKLQTTARLRENTIIKASKKTEEATAKLTKRTASRNNKKLQSPTTYVALNVGDIHVGFHQADLTEEEKALRQFDLTPKFGPCTDITRLERWERAFNLGLNPPEHVKDTIANRMKLNTPLFEGRV